MKSLKSQNYYEILGVERDASPEEIRQAYEISTHAFQKNSLATYSLFTDEENQEILAQISRAYETLRDPRLRAEYDDFLDGLEGREAGHAPASRRAAAPQHAAAAHAPGGHSGAQAAGHEPEAAGEGNGGEDAAESYIRSLETFDGQALKKIRQMRGISIEEIAEHTKIRKTYIQYIEEENFRFLPAAIYVKGFITMIAGMLQLPPQKVAEEYMQHYRGEAE